MEMTYGQLLRQVSGKGRSILVTKNSNMEILHPFVQYGETDWEFVKRIAGHLETTVVSDTCHLFPQVSVGMVQGKTHYIQEPGDCETEKNIKNWRYLYGSGPMSNSFSLKIEGTLEMNLSDKIIYNGIKFAVLKKEILLSDGALNCSCWIGKEQIRTVGKYYNNHLCGLRLSGIVETVSGVKIKIKLNIDKVYEDQELYEFTYLPITGNGMYAMPALGSTVHLYFPDNNERNAFAVDCLSSDILAGKSPAYRTLEDEQNKFVELLPAVLNISSNEKKIEISDNCGVEIISDKEIRLHARGDIIV